MSFKEIIVQGGGVLVKNIQFFFYMIHQNLINNKTHLPTLILSYFENPLALPESTGRLNLSHRL